MEDDLDVRLLLDTNVYLEVLLEQTKAEEARALLTAIDDHEFFLSDFSLHSIGLTFFRSRQHSTFGAFLHDALNLAGTMVVSLELSDMEAVIENGRKFGLDFDDAYQYTVADKYNLILVSLDRDFDRTTRGRKTPSETVGASTDSEAVIRRARRPREE